MSRLVRPLIRITLTLGIIVGIILVVVHPVFRLQSVQVDGEIVTPSAALARTFSHWRGRHVGWAMVAILRREWMSEFPTVSGAKVTWLSINRIHIQIIDKRPSIGFVTPRESVWVSQDGTILNPGGRPMLVTNLESIPLIRGISGSALTGIRVEPQVWHRVQTVVTQVDSILPRYQFQIHFDRGNMILLKDDVIPILVGSVSNLKKKLTYLKYFLAHSTENMETIRAIDVRIPGKVVVRYWENPPPGTSPVSPSHAEPVSWD